MYFDILAVVFLCAVVGLTWHEFLQNPSLEAHQAATCRREETGGVLLIQRLRKRRFFKLILPTLLCCHVIWIATESILRLGVCPTCLQRCSIEARLVGREVRQRGLAQVGVESRAPRLEIRNDRLMERNYGMKTNVFKLNRKWQQLVRKLQRQFDSKKCRHGLRYVSRKKTA